MTDYAAIEAEANAFAMELLMPFEWLAQDCRGVDVSDENAIAKLAKKYQVAPTVMALRIGEIRAALSPKNTESEHD